MARNLNLPKNLFDLIWLIWCAAAKKEFEVLGETQMSK